MEGTFHSESLFYEYAPNHVPKPHAWGSFKADPSTSFYLCDFHDMADEVPEYQKFVSIIVKIHKDSMGKKERYGFDLPTYLGNLPNDNTWQDSWETWFAQAMRQMFQIEEMAHGKDDELDVLKKDIFEKVIPRLLRPLETGGRSIKPCLVHSDLWPGNSMPDAETNEIFIFDSCAFWGHNEADLGSWYVFSESIFPLVDRFLSRASRPTTPLQLRNTDSGNHPGEHLDTGWVVLS